MVKEQSMQISEFAHAAGISTDTVRFYVKRGLLEPEVGTNKYQMFDDSHLNAVRLIVSCQALGFTIRQMCELHDECKRTGIGPARRMEILKERLGHLRAKADQLARVIAYAETKLKWLERGQVGPEPFMELEEQRKVS
jgi:MerR family transcriptional regulator, copper efflux regulator